jgi:selenocysteine lyase/cysteine desulfurase
VNSTRRTWLQAMSLLPFTVGSNRSWADASERAASSQTPGSLGKEDFALGGATYLDAAAIHPMTIHAAAAMDAYKRARLSPSQEIGDADDPRALFAKVINASADEVAVMPCTTAGENSVISGLGLRGSKHRIVTDALHFSGSLCMYEQLAKEGMDIHVVKPRGMGIDLNDVAAGLTPGTRLIAVSLVSMFTGYKHDLKALCDLAHSHGALVYADIIQAAGNIPIDVRATNVDFLACSTYKWLMGDYGVGFLYTRKDLLSQIRRPQLGYQQTIFTLRHLPFDPTDADSHQWTEREDARGYYESGSEAKIVLRCVSDSLKRILACGVENIAGRRQPLTDFLRAHLPPLGFEPLANASNSALSCFKFEGAAARLSDKLRRANVSISLYENRVRISPSVYNDMADVERLVDVLSS